MIATRNGTAFEKSVTYHILFDGVCNLCNGAVRFVIRHDKKERFMFSPLQSPVATALLAGLPSTVEKMDSVVFIENGTIYTRSTAILKIARRLGGGWSLLYGFIIIPPFLRDGIYDIIAKYRYRFFGKQEKCMIPSAADSRRFLE